MNLLVLSYYFPPLGMSGVQRTLKFVKYLPAAGWHPVVVSPRPRGGYGYDPSLLDEAKDAAIIRTFSLDPASLSGARHRPSAVERHGAAAALGAWALPDAKAGWVPWAVSAGLRAAETCGIDAIYSTAPPHSSHLAGVLLQRMLRRPLVCDFRDAWTRYTWARYPTALHARIDRRLERAVVQEADLVIAVNQAILDGLMASHPHPDQKKFTLVPHGFDPADFASPPEITPGHFRIVHAGTFIRNRGPQPLLDALRILRERQPPMFESIRVTFVGAHRHCDVESVRRAGLDGMIAFTGYLPHRRSVEHLQGATALWLVMGPEETANVTPGKMFEYLGARKPILASIPAGGEAAAIIAATSAGTVVDPGDPAALADTLAALLDGWQRGESLYRGDPEAVARYDRRRSAVLLGSCLDDLVGARGYDAPLH
jgi:glycosyltransferase involved in cell wall biosynthesis